jgi:toxin-antitoxin system PIN domain toxin
VIIPDVNVLLYAFVPSYREHAAAKKWLETMLSEGKETVGIAWQVLTAFLRIGTNPRVFNIPFKIEDAILLIQELLEQSLVQIVSPTGKHWQIFSKILREEQVTTNLVMDAHLAALAIEHNAKLATIDRDFARFSSLKTINPLKK